MASKNFCFVFITVACLVACIECVQFNDTINLNCSTSTREASVVCLGLNEEEKKSLQGQSKSLDDFNLNNFCENFNEVLIINISRSECRLPYIPQQFFERFPYITEVRLNHQGVESIKAGDFRTNVNLSTLALVNNNLTSLPEFLFVYIPQIRSIDFTNNQIQTIHEHTFADGVNNLRRINLSNNFIKSLPYYVFEGPTRLFELNLNYNLLNSFEVNLRQLTNLSTLLLSNNQIERLGCNVFGIQGIQTIDASGNGLLEVATNCVGGQDAIKGIFVNLEDNRLKSISVRFSDT